MFEKIGTAIGIVLVYAVVKMLLRLINAPIDMGDVGFCVAWLALARTR